MTGRPALGCWQGQSELCSLSHLGRLGRYPPLSSISHFLWFLLSSPILAPVANPDGKLMSDVTSWPKKAGCSCSRKGFGSGAGVTSTGCKPDPWVPGSLCALRQVKSWMWVLLCRVSKEEEAGDRRQAAIPSWLGTPVSLRASGISLSLSS